MKKPIRLILAFMVLLCVSAESQAQSLELMAGHERIFADVQWFKALASESKWSVFSRTRATVDYENNTNLFSGAYLNYTGNTGLGASLVGKIGQSGAGADAGIHLFKNRKTWMLFGLASVGLKSRLEYSWFSIFRFTPAINERWKWYTSLELFSLFTKAGHAFSVQRVRVGFSVKGVQFGLAANFSESGRELSMDDNFGLFLRKTF